MTERKSDEELMRLYRQSLGMGAADDFFELLKHPAVLTAFGALSFVSITLVLIATLENFQLLPACIVSITLLSWVAYLSIYINLLAHLWWVDRTACGLCAFGLVGPAIFFLYLEEIGKSKVAAAVGAFLAAAAGTGLCLLVRDQIPQEIWDLFAQALS